MAEITLAEMHQIFEPKTALRTRLEILEIPFPNQPDPQAQTPRPWLIRAEPKRTRLMENEAFQPQSGQMGTCGVFLGDCYSSLMYPNEGIYYVYGTPSVGKTLSDLSPEYTMRMNQLAEEHHLDPTTLSGGLEAQRLLFNNANIYQPRQGIVTVHSPLSIEQAHAILVTPQLLTEKEMSRLSPEIQKKIHQL